MDSSKPVHGNCSVPSVLRPEHPALTDAFAHVDLVNRLLQAMTLRNAHRTFEICRDIMAKVENDLSKALEEPTLSAYNRQTMEEMKADAARLARLNPPTCDCDKCASAPRDEPTCDCDKCVSAANNKTA